MIELTKISGDKIIINAEEIETIETSHDSKITLKSGKKIMVKESSEEITAKSIAYKNECYAGLLQLVGENES